MLYLLLYTLITHQEFKLFQKNNAKFYSLIKEFEKKTGVPVLLNTSLNVNEPICENPENAFEIFTKTSMDALGNTKLDINQECLILLNIKKTLILFLFSYLFSFLTLILTL